MIFQIAAQGVWTWKELLHEVPWCAVLAAINDCPRYKPKEKGGAKGGGAIASEKEAKEFFGL